MLIAYYPISLGNLDLKNEKGDEMGHRHMGATLHWGPFNGANGYEKTTASKYDNFLVSYITIQFTSLCIY